MWVTVVETQEFSREAAGIFSQVELDQLITHLAMNPSAGDLVAATGGVRKFRWGARGKGKSGGARVVHFFRQTKGTVYLLTAFAKGEQVNLTQAERNAIRKLVKTL